MLSALLWASGRVSVLITLFAQVFDGTVWKTVTGCRSAPMNTTDTDITKQDVHAWLFGWKNETIFQVCHQWQVQLQQQCCILSGRWPYTHWYNNPAPMGEHLKRNLQDVTALD